MENGGKKKIIVVAEIFLITIGIVLGFIWNFNPGGHYEPSLAIIGLLLVIAEYFRWSLEAVSKNQLNEMKLEILDRMDIIAGANQNIRIPPIGTRVVVADGSRLTQRDKLTVPIWLSERERYSEKHAFITGYREGFYTLNIDNGKHVWPGRWLKKV